MPSDVCEYCNRDDVVLYAWHADTWCADCIAAYADRSWFTRLVGSVEDAPVGRPDDPEGAEPWLWQTPDGVIVEGELRA